ncbi:hypothetical protein MHBO_001264 [Bonamia ostreae]|uniref:Uncharacterized protein n=1 Tax=Bonamia ostreae TaxID=126728 RepID=A0ABV2AIC5_9EUKA
MGLDEMDMMEKARHLRRQRKLLRMISDFDGLAEEESLALLVSVGATGILDSVAEEHVLDFGNEFLAELRFLYKASKEKSRSGENEELDSRGKTNACLRVAGNRSVGRLCFEGEAVSERVGFSKIKILFEEKQILIVLSSRT